VGAAFAKSPTRPIRPDFAGRAQIEAYSVEAIHSGPTRATFAALTDAGERVWGRSEDPDLMAELLADEEACGREARFLDGMVELG
jgi:hypothetical protein